MHKFLTDQKFLQNRLDSKHYFFGNVSQNHEMPSISWGDVIGCLDDGIKKNSFIKFLSGYRFVIHDHSYINSIQTLVNSISKLDPAVRCSAHVYMHLMGSNDGFGSHRDKSDVIFWQVIGKTFWSIDDDKKYEYILNPGDCIYVPRGMFHDVKSLSPRVGISFGLDYN